MMRFLIVFFIVSVCFGILLASRWIFSINRLRRQNLYPAIRPPTMFDVRELILKGEKEAAVKLYCEIFKTNSKEAKKAVEELDKSIQNKT